jgi:hypothetical protein
MGSVSSGHHGLVKKKVTKINTAGLSAYHSATTKVLSAGSEDRVGSTALRPAKKLTD